MYVTFRSPLEVLMASSSNFVLFTIRMACPLAGLSAPMYVRATSGGNVGGGFCVGPALPWVRVYFSSRGVSLQRSDMNPLTSRCWVTPYVNGFVKYTGSSTVTLKVN